ICKGGSHGQGQKPEEGSQEAQEEKVAGIRVVPVDARAARRLARPQPFPFSIRGAVMRTNWVAKRQNDTIRTQMYYARKGIVTEEMHYIAQRESLAPELVRSEVGRGRMIIPANIHHTNLEPMCIGVASKCKINSNIGNSSVTSDISGELEKLEYSVKYGADTVM